MYVDVTDLKKFYNTPLGQVALEAISNRIYARWANLSGLSLLGLGYTTPYLEKQQQKTRSCLSFMPASQGVTVWANKDRVKSCLVHNRNLPLSDNSVDRILCVHSLELSQSADEVLSELWRVLTPRGRILLVVPNRSGMWARSENTPFGSGHPYSYRQLDAHLRHHRFTPEGSSEALFMPPSNYPFILRQAKRMERYGNKVWLPFAGVILMEASKRILNPIQPTQVPIFTPRRFPIPVGITPKTSHNSSD